MSNETDRNLLELAAKAAGMHANQWADPGELLPDKGGWVQFIGMCQVCIWNPLTDDGDALRLAVKLAIDLLISDWHVLAIEGESETDAHAEEFARSNPCAATRRAIVRAAAEIGKAQP